MEAKTNYTVVGIIVLILIGGLISTMLWLSVGFNQKNYHLYEVHMREATSGLNNEAPVKFNGVQVGFVKRIGLNQDDPQEVNLLLNIEEGTPITVSTTATLIAQGITGNTYVGLSATSSDLTPLRAVPPNPYPIIPAKPSLLKQLDSVLKDVGENINKVSLRVDEVLDKENIMHIKESLGNIKTATAVLASDSKMIHRSLTNLDVVLKNGAKASEKFGEAMGQLEGGIKHFNQMADSMKQAGSGVAETMRSGKVAIDKISQQALPPAVVLLQRLETIAVNLEKLSTQLRQNPSVVVRGLRAPPLGPGEKP
ncbi:MAG: MCE family protein [Legionella sp.]|nr:MCE family protein [Legionella sp.]